MTTITHKTGELIGLSFGEYSDYQFNGLYKCLQDIDLGELSHKYLEQAPVSNWSYRKDASDTGFGSYLIKLGLVEELSYEEIHCGCYGFDVEDIYYQLQGRYKKAKESKI